MANKTVVTEAAFIPAGKDGDTIQVPKPVRENASLKVADTDVNLLSSTAAQLTVNIVRHFEYSVYERITEVQALASMKPFYTSDAGYALATASDNDLHALGATLDGGAAYSNGVIGSDGTTLYTGANAAALTEDGFIDAVATLDDNNVPMNMRSLIVTPRTKATMLKIDRFNSSDFISNRPSMNGMFGELFGVNVLVSTNCATTGSDRACLLLHRDALVMVSQQSVEVRQQYEILKTGTVVSSTSLYGVSQWQDNHALAIGQLLLTGK